MSNEINGVPKQDIINVLEYLMQVASTGKQMVSPNEAGAILQNLGVANQLINKLKEETPDQVPLRDVPLSAEEVDEDA